MEKQVIDPMKARLVSNLLVSGLVMILVFILTGTVMNKALKNAEAQYYDNCEQILEGYSNAIYYYIENYHTSLTAVFDEDLFETGDMGEIHKWMIKNDDLMHEDIDKVFYVNKYCNGYISDGRILDLSEVMFFKDSRDAKSSFYVSDIFNSKYVDYPVVIIEEPYLKNGVLEGLLCCSIKVNLLEKITEKINIGGECSVYLTDRTGRFLVHPMEEYVGKIFIPSKEKYKHITSDQTAFFGNSVVETENENGEVVNLFSSRIENCGWTLSVAFPKKYLVALYKQNASIKLSVIAIAVAALIALVFIDMFVIERFYKHQLMRTDYDSLTNLWTRQHFENEATKLLKNYSNSKFMMIECDIRGFKFINQNYGAEVADQVIFQYSILLNELTRMHHGIIGRGYADHFYSLFRVEDVRHAMKTFRNGLEVLIDKVKKSDIPYVPKFGITFLRPENNKSVTIQQLIGQATFAKNQIKDDMLTYYAIYNARANEKVNDERFMELEMENALSRGEFFVVYQPKISLATDKIVGAEALVRWKTEERGIIMPDKFIPLFERNGFIKKLDFYVYEEVFKFLQKRIDAGLPVVPISLNMSRNHNRPEKFIHDFMELFCKYSIPANLVQIEIIERSVMDSTTLRDITERLHDEGFSVAMDDFGSGESSLNMLTQVPVDVLKFDRDFLRSSTRENGELDEKSAKFISILIDLSKHLDKETVFEGVETKTQRDFLRSINCDQAQGYFYSRPLTEDDFVVFLTNNS